MNKTYITAVEAVSWIAFREYDALAKLENAQEDGNVRKAAKDFIENLIEEKLAVRGANQHILIDGKHGDLNIVPVAFLLREDIGLDLCCNKFDSLMIRDSYSLNKGEEEKRPVPWINLLVKSVDVLKVWPPAGKTSIGGIVTEPEAENYLLKAARENGGEIPARDIGWGGAYQYFQAAERRLFWKTYRAAHKHITENAAEYNIKKPNRGRRKKTV